MLFSCDIVMFIVIHVTIRKHVKQKQIVHARGLRVAAFAISNHQYDMQLANLLSAFMIHT